MTGLDVLETVQEFRATTPEPDQEQVSEARRAFRVALAESASQRPRRWLSLPRVRVPILAGAAGVLTAALTLGVVGLPGGGPGIDPAAAATLNAVADATTEQPAVPTLAEGQFWYERSEFWQPAVVPDAPVGGSAEDSAEDEVQPEVRGTYERWVSLDGTMRIVRREDGAVGLDIDETVTGEPLLLGSSLGGTLDEVAALPRDPQALYNHVERVTRELDNGRPVPVEMFVLVRDLLREPLLPQDLREALYRVAAEIPGVQVTEAVEDQLGRQGTAIWLLEDDSGSREEFLVDPATGQPLAERSLGTNGDVLFETAVVEWGVVESIDTQL